MHCKNCHYKDSMDYNYCPNCGKRIGVILKITITKKEFIYLIRGDTINIEFPSTETGIKLVLTEIYWKEMLEVVLHESC